MSKKQEILIINQYYPPDTSATASIAQTVAEVLAKQYKVRILAGRPSYNPNRFHPWYLFKTTIHKAISVTRVGSSAMSRHHMVKRLFNYFSYLFLTIPQVIAAKPAAILCMTDPPIAGLIGAYFSKKKNCPFIYYIQDLHPDMAMSSGMIAPGFFLNIWKFIHHWILKRADLIIVLDKDMRKRIIAKGIQPEKVTVIRHGTPPNFDKMGKALDTVERITKHLRITIIHAGNIGFYGAWKNLIKAADLLKKDNAGFIFIGEGAYKSELKKLAARCSNVWFLPFQPEEDIPKVMASGDIHLITMQTGIEGMVSPSKFYSIIAAGRPVFGVVGIESDLAKVIRKNKCGVIADPDDPYAIAEAVRELSRNQSRLIEMSNNSSDLSTRYDSLKQFNKFVSIVTREIDTWLGATIQTIKVLRVISRMNIGGPSIHVKLLQEGLDRNRFHSMLLTGKISQQEGDMSYILNSEIQNVLYIPELQREVQISNDLKAFFKILKIINKKKPQIVHSHTAKAGTLARSSVLLYNVLFWQNIKTLHTFHGHVFKGYFDKKTSTFFTFAERLLAQFTDVIIAISQTQRKELVYQYHIAKDSKFKTIRLGFNLSHFLNNSNLQGQFKKELNIEKDCILVGIIGRLVPIKNHIMFLKAARLLIAQLPELKLKFLIIGDGELKDELKTYCAENDLSHHVHFCGWVKNIPYVYADLDIVALTSINEGTPVSIIEAMSASVPIITTDAGGIKDLLGEINILPSSDGFKICERGVLLPQNNAQSLANGVKFILDNLDFVKKSIVSNAKTFAIENYHKERLIGEIESLYARLMNKKETAKPIR